MDNGEKKNNSDVDKSAKVTVHALNKLSLCDIQELIASVVGHKPLPRWAKCNKQNDLAGCSVIVVPTLDLNTQRQHNVAMPTIRNLAFSHNVLQAPVTASIRPVLIDKQSRCSILDHLFSVAHPDPKDEKIIQFLTPTDTDNAEKLGSVLSNYLASPHELHQNQFPLYVRRQPKPNETDEEKSLLGSLAVPEGFCSVEVHINEHSESLVGHGKTLKSTIAKWNSSVDLEKHLLAIDCEMVETTLGKELARVAIVNGKFEKVLDLIVKPQHAVKNYLTRYSGITKEMLDGPNVVTLSDVHAHLRQILFPESILVGHSLENDLMALRLIHSRVIDSSLLYPHASPHCKQSLVYLMRTYLKERLLGRDHSSIGHDPYEDAKAALRLVLLKAANGPAFGSSKRGKNVILKGLNTLLDSQTRLTEQKKLDNGLISSESNHHNTTDLEQKNYKETTDVSNADHNHSSKKIEPGCCEIVLFDSQHPRSKSQVFESIYSKINLDYVIDEDGLKIRKDVNSDKNIENESENYYEETSNSPKRKKTIDDDISSDDIANDRDQNLDVCDNNLNPANSNPKLSHSDLDNEAAERFLSHLSKNSPCPFQLQLQQHACLRILVLRELQRTRCSQIGMHRTFDYGTPAKKVLGGLVAKASIAAVRSVNCTDDEENNPTINLNAPGVEFPKIESAITREIMTRVDNTVRRILDSAPEGHVVILLSGYGDAPRYLALSGAKNLFHNYNETANDCLSTSITQEKGDIPQENTRSDVITTETSEKLVNVEWTNEWERELEIARLNFNDSWGCILTKSVSKE